MLQQCKLVHADLSEYNILYHKDKPYIIDVSQSVEGDHPRSLDFLRMDIKNVSDFFKRQGVAILSDRRTYEFITSHTASLEYDALRTEIDKIMSERREDEEDDEVANEVFRKQYIPQTLEAVYDHEKDGQTLNTSGRDGLVYKDLLAPLKNEKVDDKATTRDQDPDADAEEDADPDQQNGASLDQDASDDSSNDSDDAFSDSEAGPPRGKRFQDKEEKKAHKQKVKEEKREKRKEKMPKSVKKKLMSQSSRRN
jgi:RIO kinase 1